MAKNIANRQMDTLDHFQGGSKGKNKYYFAYSKTATLKKTQNWFSKPGELKLNAGQKNCRMLQGGAFCNNFDLH